MFTPLVIITTREDKLLKIQFPWEIYLTRHYTIVAWQSNIQPGNIKSNRQKLIFVDPFVIWWRIPSDLEPSGFHHLHWCSNLIDKMGFSANVFLLSAWWKKAKVSIYLRRSMITRGLYLSNPLSSGQKRFKGFFVSNRGDTVSRRSPIQGVRPSPYTTLCS